MFSHVLLVIIAVLAITAARPSEEKTMEVKVPGGSIAVLPCSQCDFVLLDEDQRHCYTCCKHNWCQSYCLDFGKLRRDGLLPQ